MKTKKNFINMTILSSLLFFTACSNKQKDIKPSENKNVSIYNIMGITETKNKNIQVFQQEVQNIPNASDTFELSTNTFTISPDIEYISYKEPTYMEQASVNNDYALIDNIKSNAKQFLGVPYVWGATGPNKFDCSGFTQWVYRDAGINIPRVSRDQAKVGEYVRYEDLKAGDMVFFDTKKHRKGIVTHVGIYLGNGDFIHASSAGKKVVIYNFNKKNFYKKRFLWGRRVTENSPHYASN